MAETYRDIRPSDYDDLTILARDWSVVRQLGGWNWPWCPNQIKERSKPYDGDGFVWAICRDDRLIGSIGVTGGDLGYMLRPDYHRQGIMGRAARTAVHTAFATSDRSFLTAGVWHDNPGSFALLTSLGFVHWQTRYERSRARGCPVLVYYSKLTRTAWDSLSASAQ